MEKLTPGNFVEDKEMLGRRDAFHVPAVLVETWGWLQPGEFVRFADDSFKRVESAETLTPHAIVDPFLDEKGTQGNKLFWVFLLPNIAQQLVHDFEIHLPEMTALEEEVMERRKEDPNCAECWQIEGGKVVRY